MNAPSPPPFGQSSVLRWLCTGIKTGGFRAVLFRISPELSISVVTDEGVHVFPVTPNDPEEEEFLCFFDQLSLGHHLDEDAWIESDSGARVRLQYSEPDEEDATAFLNVEFFRDASDSYITVLRITDWNAAASAAALAERLSLDESAELMGGQSLRPVIGRWFYDDTGGAETTASIIRVPIESMLEHGDRYAIDRFRKDFSSPDAAHESLPAPEPRRVIPRVQIPEKEITLVLSLENSHPPLVVRVIGILDGSPLFGVTVPLAVVTSRFGHTVIGLNEALAYESALLCHDEKSRKRALNDLLAVRGQHVDLDPDFIAESERATTNQSSGFKI